MPMTNVHARRSLVVAAVVGLVLCAQPAYAQRNTVCDCPDVSDLIHRLNLVHAAIDALNGQIKRFEAEDQARGRQSTNLDRSSVNSANTNQQDIREAITANMRVVQMPGSEIVFGDTDPSCESSITGHATMCLEEVAMWHEDKVHVPACTKAPKTALGFRAPQATVD